MQIVIRTARHEEYEALCMLYSQVDNVHAEALPEFFRPVEGPTRSREFFTGIFANEDAAIFVAENEGSLVGVISCFVEDTPQAPFIVPRRFVHVDDMVVD